MTNKKFSAMTGWELRDWWFALSRDVRSAADAMCALRDAIRSEALEEFGRKSLDVHTELHALRTRAERAERERDDAYAGQKHHKAKAGVYLDRARTAEAQLAEAKREALWDAAAWIERGGLDRDRHYAELLRVMGDGKYPKPLATAPSATPSGEGRIVCGPECNPIVCKDGCQHRTRPATPQPEPLVIPVQVKMGTDWWVDTAEYRITITPTLARRIVAMGQ